MSSATTFPCVSALRLSPVVVAALALLLLLSPPSFAADDGAKARDGQFSFTVKSRQRTLACEAHVRLAYTRLSDEVVEVQGTLENDTCAASSGRLTIAVRTRDAQGELTEVEHVEAWAREDASPLTLTRRYPIAAGVELSRVRTKTVRCRCAEAVEIEAPPD